MKKTKNRKDPESRMVDKAVAETYKAEGEGWTEGGLKKAKAALATARKFVSPSAEAVKTSLKLPKALWREATIRALDEGRDLQDVVADALAVYLKSASKRQGGSR